MKSIKDMNKWKNYKIRYEFKNTEKLEKDIQMLCYMDDELVYASKKNSFKKKTIKIYGLKLNNWYLPHYEPIEKEILVWANDKEHSRFINFCKKFRLKTCIRLQDELKIEQCNYKKL